MEKNDRDNIYKIYKMLCVAYLMLEERDLHEEFWRKLNQPKESSNGR